MKHLLGTSYNLIKEAISYFDDVRPVLQATLSKSLIHNDINPGNVLYDRNGNLAGIIDFTEICHTYRICEVGVALAYIMQISGNDYLAAGRGFINGYAKGYDLSASEKKYLLLFIKLRLSITIIYNTRHLHLDRLLTSSQAGFIRHAKELLANLSDAANDGFIKKMFSPR
ncbi:MAG: phosphotransferase [Rhodobacteraceae bacterium]|nr:phosphotransferase [Paracoccaceae bacterium]